MNQSFVRYLYYLLLAALILSGVLIRSIALGDKPMHHDEILHAVISLGFSENPDQAYYKYNPMLHGPVLYHSLASSFQMFGISEVSARLPITILGVLFILTPLLLNRYLSRTAVIAGTLLIAFSPILVFFSRFAIHDYFIIAATLIMFLGVIYLKPKFRALVVFPAISLQIAIKQNAFITVTLLVIYLLFEHYYYRAFAKGTISILKTIATDIKSQLIFVVAGLLLSILVFVYFFSGGFRDFSLVTNNPFNSGFSYWAKEHSNERLGGIFAYNLIVYLMYELPFILLLFALVLTAFYHSTKTLKLYILSVFAFAAIAYIFSSENIHAFGSILSLFKLRTPLDISCFIIIIGSGIWVTIFHLHNGHKALAFLGYFFFSTFFTYSFVGEKVPWLAEYPLITGLAYLILFFDVHFIKTASFKARLNKLLCFFILFLSACYGINGSLLSSHYQNGSPSELLSQVHTTRQLRAYFYNIIENYERDHLRDLRVLTADSAAWAAYWYLRNYGFEWDIKDKSYNAYDVVMKDGEKCDDILLNLGFACKITSLYGWWQPDFENINFLEVLGYSFTHQPFDYEPAYSHMALYYNPATFHADLRIADVKN